jgi:hypothetical protein
MTTLTAMKSRIASEFRRDDLTTDIADAITTAIAAYSNERFSFNQTTAVAAPATDGEAGNAWMTTAERLIRARAKLEIVLHVLDQPEEVMVKGLNAEIQDALRSLRLSTTHASTATADTLGAMKLRIANELNRSDLTDEIANAINDAIEAYSHMQFFFNETRAFTFTTTADTSRYTSTDSGWANLAKILKIDFVMITLNGQAFGLEPRFPEWFEHNLVTSSNTPGYYGWYAETLVLYPTPNDALSLRIGCIQKVAAPASDGETLNPWMTKAERLIRNRAKAELYAHVDDIMDDKKAQKFMTLADEALEKLEERTLRLTQVGPLLVVPFN